VAVVEKELEVVGWGGLRGGGEMGEHVIDEDGE
jgi:hypothetical protein